MIPVHADRATIRKILTATGDTWAVVGLSANQDRAAYGVAASCNVSASGSSRSTPGRRASTASGATPRRRDPFPVDVVDVFVNSGLAGAVADQAVAIGARAVWFQLGVIDEEACDAHPRRRPRHGHGPLPGDRDPPIGLRRRVRSAHSTSAALYP